MGDSDILPCIPKDGVDIVTSGMPCETFSTAGSTSRSFYDDRQFLFEEGIRVAKAASAKMILFENVPAILTKRVSADSSRLVVDAIRDRLAASGYGNRVEAILDASEFGVPQKRKRFFILASRYPRLDIRLPKPRMDGVVVSVGDALAGLGNVIPNSNEENRRYTDDSSDYSALMRNDLFWRRDEFHADEVSYQMPMRHRGYILKRMGMIGPGEGLGDVFERVSDAEKSALQKERILPRRVFYNRNYRLRMDRPSPTVTSHCLDEYIHPLYDRALTVRECARLQSFPDSYDFCGGPYLVPHTNRMVQDKYEQIGDAVPPLLAYEWGMAIASIA